MPKVVIGTRAIHDWASLHAVCKEAFGFPDFYGNNGDAFIDCLTYLDEGDGMSRFTLKPSETLTIELTGADAFAGRATEQAVALLAWIGAVNERHRRWQAADAPAGAALKRPLHMHGAVVVLPPR